MSDAGLSTADKDARIAELEAALAAAHADISARDILIDTLRVQIARLKRMQFGKSSEKLDTQIAQLELALEELEGEAIVAAARRADPAEVDRRRLFVRCLLICRGRNSGSSPNRAVAPVQIAAERCGLWGRIATRCSMPCQCNGVSFGPSGPSIAAGPARRSSRRPCR